MSKQNLKPWQRADQIRLKKYLSIIDVAERMTAAGCSESKGGVSEILAGKRWAATWKRINALAFALGCDPKDLFA